MITKRLLPLMLTLCLLSGCALAPTTDPTPSESAPPVETTAPAPVPELTPLTLPYYPDATLDPATVDQRANLTLTSLLYDGLFQLDSTFTAQPKLCKKYTVSGDGLVWTLTLQSALTFSDGTPLTPSLVAHSLRAAMQEGARYAVRLSGITDIQADDENNTVTITLSAPNSGLPALLDVPITLPQEDSPLTPLGTGLYVLSEDGSALTLRVPSDNYPAEIPLYPVYQVDDYIAAFDAGYTSFVDTDFTATQASHFSASYEAWSYPTTDFIYLAFNTQSGAPCASAQLRYTISMAVNRNDIVQRDFAQYATAATLPVSPVSPLYDAMLAATNKYSAEALATQVAQITAPSAPLRLVVMNENASKLAAAQRIADTLTAVGVDTSVVSLAWDDYLLALEQGDFDLYLAEVRLSADFDLTRLIGTDGALNYGGYSSVETDDMLAIFRAQAQTSHSAATQLYTHLLDQAPIVPICFKSGTVLTQWGRVSDVTPTQANQFYQLHLWTFHDDVDTPESFSP